MLKIYCARPINGCTIDEIRAYYGGVKKKLNKIGYDVLTPMIQSEYVRVSKKFQATAEGMNPGASNRAIVSRDHWLVKNCDILYINLLSAQSVSIGSVSELAWAYDNGKHIVMVIDKENNPHKHAFVLEMADVIYDNEKDAIQYLEDLNYKTKRSK